MTIGTAPPPVTIGVPVYNGERFLAAALTSLQEQDFTDFEVIVADNASTDGTEEIARSFTEADSRFVYRRNTENIGGARNSNLLLNLARSPFFKWSYHDDINAPRLLSGLFSTLDEAGPEAVAAYPRVILIDEDGVQVGQHDDATLNIMSSAPHERLAELLKRVVGQVQFGLMRTKVAREAGGIPISIAGEMVMPAALAVRGKLMLLHEPALAIRVHESRHGGDRASEAAWIDPSRPRAAFPYSRSTPLLVRAVLMSRLSASEKLRCVKSVLWHWTRPGWKTIAGDLIRLPRDLRLMR
jgi:glycosyltransferase involved in cell wall biosynthesis